MVTIQNIITINVSLHPALTTTFIGSAATPLAAADKTLESMTAA
jgi:hypothetical protein